MAHYTQASPSLPPLVHGRDPASATVLGAPVDDHQYFEAHREEALAEALFQDRKISEAQLTATMKRKHIIGNQVTSPGLNGPVWAQQIIIEMNNRFDEVNERFDEVNERLDRVITDAQQTRIELRNDRRRVDNRKAVTSSTPVALTPLCKERAGLGEGIPGNFIRWDVPDIEQGQLIEQHFPNSLEELDSVTLPQVDFLARVFNNNFGIVAQDSAKAKRMKFRSFVLFGN